MSLLEHYWGLLRYSYYDTTEKKEYRTKEALQKYNVEFEGEDDPESPANPDEEESPDESECESLTPSEIREI